MNFAQVEVEYRRLKAQVTAGTLAPDEFKAKLQDLMVQDEQGRWWSVGFETGQWHVHDGERWVAAEPPGETTAPGEDTALPVIPPPAEPDREATPEPAALPLVMSAGSQEPLAEAGRKPWLWVALGILVVAIAAVVISRQAATPAPSKTTTAAAPSVTPLPATNPSTVYAAGAAATAALAEATTQTAAVAQTSVAMQTAAVVQTAAAVQAVAGVQTAAAQATTEVRSTATTAARATATAEQTVRATQTAEAKPQLAGRLVFQRRAADNRLNDIYIYDLKTGATTRMTSDGAENHIPRWAPSGKQITFTTNRQKGGEYFDIWTMNDDRTDSRALIATGAWDEYATWASDGKQLAFVSTGRTDGVDNSEIFIGRSDGSYQRITTNKARDEWPTWSPDGKQIAIGSNRNGTMDIWVMDANGQNARAIVSSRDDENQPAWAPNGTQIAYIHRAGNQEAYGNIMLVARDGSGLQQLTKTGDAANPAWSPDGQWLVFSRWVDTNKSGRIDTGDESDLWTIRVSDRQLFPVIVEPGQDGAPSWAR